MTLCYLSVGGNVGDVDRTFDSAFDALANAPTTEVLATSGRFETRPMGGLAGRTAFLNAAACVRTSSTPLELLDFLQLIEDSLGRTRGVRWGPRTIDLDLILWNDAVIDEPRLTVPHPACWHRRFVLDALIEIGPDAIHPIHTLSIAELQRRLTVRPFPLTLIGGTPELRERIRNELAPEFPEVAFLAWAPGEVASMDGGLVVRLGDAAGIIADDLPTGPQLELIAGRDPSASLRDVLVGALDTPIRRKSGP